MAPPAGTLRVGRYFAGLFALLIALYALIVFPGQRHVPKLGIDLVGGIRVVFKAQTPKGTPSPTSSQMTQARQILEDRINTTGVTGSTVVVQGSNQLVVEIPNGTGTDVAKLGKAAVLNFRGVMTSAQLVSCGQAVVQPSGSATPSSSVSSSPSSTGSGTSTVSSSPSGSASRSAHDFRHHLLTAPVSRKTPSHSATASHSATPTSSSTPTSSASASSTAPASHKCTADPFASLAKSDPSLKPLLEPSIKAHQVGLNAETCPSPAMPDGPDNKTTAPCHGFTSLTSTQQSEITAALANYKCGAAQNEADIPYNYYIACDDGLSFGTPGHPVYAAYLLGHVVVPGKHIGSAVAQAPNISSGQAEWTVSLTLGGSGANAWHDWTSKYNTTSSTAPQNGAVQVSGSPACGASAVVPCSDFVGFTLDGQVISAPVTLGVLSTQTQISGSFTQSSAKSLASELNYGKLPVSFHPQAIERVSATLGKTQLHAAFLAGGIGLILVVIYSLLYYRALGFVTIASLLVSGALTYAMLVILSKQIGFTLDLAGIAGFIVALGITADSFVVFFERIKDEVHEGRSLRVAVPRAWVRARRTILSADTVSFLAAAILYYFASADVKGFAFTLGMSTILDLVVVFLFTHPIVSLLSRQRAFGSASFTGLSSVRVGGIASYDEDDALPARSRPARRRRPAADETETSSVAVLEKEADEDETEVTEDDSAPEEPRERRRTTPEPGTAAERAAARRARLREQGDEKGQS